jgi:hypothetical protein
MVQPAESLLRKDPTRSYGTNPAVRCLLLKSEVRTILMMVTNIFREQSLQMADPMAALIMVPIIAKEGIEGLQGKACDECHAG